MGSQNLGDILAYVLTCAKSSGKMTHGEIVVAEAALLKLRDSGEVCAVVRMALDAGSDVIIRRSKDDESRIVDHDGQLFIEDPGGRITSMSVVINSPVLSAASSN